MLWVAEAGSGGPVPPVARPRRQGAASARASSAVHDTQCAEGGCGSHPRPPSHGQAEITSHGEGKDEVKFVCLFVILGKLNIELTGGL